MYRSNPQASERLEKLDALRSQYKDDNRSEMLAIINELVDMGEYEHTPHTEANKDNPYQDDPMLAMVEGYGAYWHIWQEPQNCPHCEADLCDHTNGPPFKREVGIYRNDVTEYFKCPDCGQYFNRFPPKHHLHHPEFEK